MNNRLRDIPKSRVFTTGFRLFTGMAMVALAAAFFTGFQTCHPDVVGWKYPPVQCTGDQGLIDSISGPLTIGWKGGVGDHLTYTLWLALAACSLFLAVLLTAYRDSDPKSVAEAARSDVPLPVNPPQRLSVLPVLGVLAVGAMVVGLALS